MKRPILKVRVGKDVLKALRRQAKQEGTTVSHISRRLIERGLEFDICEPTVKWIEGQRGT